MMNRAGTIGSSVSRHPRRLRTAGFTLIELTVVVVVIGILAAIALPAYNKIKAKAMEAEAKANLHSIQVSVEQFGVDHSGEFPKYLIGGDNAYLSIGDRQDLEIGHIVVETPQELSCDPLIRNGYQDTYPRNPFVRYVLPVQQYQEQHGDPLRSSFKDSHTGGTRFGPYGNVVGQVLCDARWMTWSYFDPKKNELVELDTWANIQYKVYDVWQGSRPRPYLPGSFMYKSMGDIYASGNDSKPGDKVTVNEQKVLAMDNRGKAVLPASTTNYILGVWGDLRTKGKDILGEEPMVIFKFKPHARIRDPRMFIFDPDINKYTLPGPVSDQISLIGIPSWTRGVNRSHIGPLWGSPYGPAQGEFEQVSIGNPNGIRDGIILVLTSDSDVNRIEQ